MEHSLVSLLIFGLCFYEQTLGESKYLLVQLHNDSQVSNDDFGHYTRDMPIATRPKSKLEALREALLDDNGIKGRGKRLRLKAKELLKPKSRPDDLRDWEKSILHQIRDKVADRFQLSQLMDKFLNNDEVVDSSSSESSSDSMELLGKTKDIKDNEGPSKSSELKLGVPIEWTPSDQSQGEVVAPAERSSKSLKHVEAKVSSGSSKSLARILLEESVVLGQRLSQYLDKNKVGDHLSMANEQMKDKEPLPAKSEKSVGNFLQSASTMFENDDFGDPPSDLTLRSDTQSDDESRQFCLDIEGNFKKPGDAGFLCKKKCNTCSGCQCSTHGLVTGACTKKLCLR